MKLKASFGRDKTKVNFYNLGKNNFNRKTICGLVQTLFYS